MVMFRASFVLLSMSLLLLTANANSTEENTMSKESAEVIQTVEAMTSSFNKKDIEGVLAMYEHGAAVMFAPGEKTSDSNELRQKFEGVFHINPQFSYPNGHEVYIANDIALHISPWVMNGEAPDGTALQQSGLSVAVLRKQKDGSWLMVLDNPNGQHLMTRP
ncbi:DUF4440 domain-containing protein [Marinomonas agarivorans]|nr:DUF4440 domain-containing protein [Marinomonas agarivorans]